MHVPTIIYKGTISSLKTLDYVMAGKILTINVVAKIAFKRLVNHISNTYQFSEATNWKTQAGINFAVDLTCIAIALSGGLLGPAGATLFTLASVYSLQRGISRAINMGGTWADPEEC